MEEVVIYRYNVYKFCGVVERVRFRARLWPRPEVGDWLSSIYAVAPRPTRQEIAHDEFGNIVLTGECSHVEQCLEMASACPVKLHNRGGVGRSRSYDERWHEADDVGKYLGSSAMTHLNSGMRDFLRRSIVEVRKADGEPERIIRYLAHLVSRRMEYATGATDASWTAARAWEAGRGVCQDFTHILLGLFRELGVPAKFVSGFALRHFGPASLHCWSDVYLASDGKGPRWLTVDPLVKTGQAVVYLACGFGRDYLDCRPISGRYQSHGKAELRTFAWVRPGSCRDKYPIHTVRTLFPEAANSTATHERPQDGIQLSS